MPSDLTETDGATETDDKDDNALMDKLIGDAIFFAFMLCYENSEMINRRYRSTELFFYDDDLLCLLESHYYYYYYYYY